jgi:D-xylose transport system permease protein
MTQATTAAQETPSERQPRSLAALIQSLEIDTRLVGMIAVLVVIWVFFNVVSGGLFLTARNLWNLSVQSSAIAVMATGMVLVIVSRNIDLSVGSILGFTGYTMAMLQVVWIPTTFGLGFNQPYTWIIALLFGMAIGAAIGAFQGAISAYVGVPSFIVTLGGLLVWRGLIFEVNQGQTIGPMDSTFFLIGGGPGGSIGDALSWGVALIACVAIATLLVLNRRRRMKYGFPLRPMWAEVTIGLAGAAAVILAVWIANSYPDPNGAPRGIAIPVLLAIGVTVVMTILATRRRFGRYVYALGGNPEAAELGGINTRRTVLLTFVLMGVLAALSGAITTARLNAAVTSLGTQSELDTIAAAVIGGTSLAGGIGTIPGAVLGAVVMQSLRSGMLLLRVDSPIQDVVVGTVLVIAVGVDSYLRRRSGR